MGAKAPPVGGGRNDQRFFWNSGVKTKYLPIVSKSTSE
jgi:hypothetical protein